MSLRDFFVLGVVSVSAFLGIRLPFVALLCFTWLAYMRPQDLCWGFAKTARFSLLIGGVMLLGYFLYERGKRPFTRWDVRTRLIFTLFLMTTLSLVFAKEQGEGVMRYYIEFLKIVVVALFTVGQVDSRVRLKAMVWTIALSLGFFGIKGGIHGVLSGGSPILQGPGGMLEDNNDFALALVMNLPLLFYLGHIEGTKLFKMGSAIAMALTCITILLTHSRGGALSMAAVLFVITIRSKYKFQAILLATIGVVAFLAFTPEHVFERLGTIKTFEEDASANARLTAWQIAFRMIEAHPVIGVGIRNFQVHWPDFSYGLTAPGGGFAYVAHNSYLQIWAEGGTIGILVYLGILGTTFASLRRLRLLGRRTEGGDWIFQYARMFEASFTGFICGAMFLNRGHFDLFYQLVALVACFNMLAYRFAATPAHERLLLHEDDDLPPLRVAGAPEPTPGWRPRGGTVTVPADRPRWGR
jgi:putative inorganic carbon (HCO3(-)) transporter